MIPDLVTEWITLDDDVWLAVKECERRRVGRVRARGLGRGHGEGDRSRAQVASNHVDGCAGEVIFRHALGMPIRPSDETWQGPDIRGIEVRATQYRNGHLVVRATDAPDTPVLLVVFSPPRQGRPFTGRLAGWIYARDAAGFPDKTPASRVFGAPGHWVPQSALSHPSTLPINGSSEWGGSRRWE